MLHEQMSPIRLSGIGVVAAFGLLTMSSNMWNSSITSMHVVPLFANETSGCLESEGVVYNSSMLFEKATGDIVSFDGISDYVHKHRRINVFLKISGISKHVSTFDFEDEYEEI